MKVFLLATLASVLAFSATAQMAGSQGAGTGNNVECVYPDGSVMYVPIGYCKLVGGKH
ncbi:hypothetical protein ATG66_3159 [Vibrio sp. ES.051]|uniref:hypothetical protein n=1 Tax=Vibrio sp. ES.051 TaxID=1761909 RepID=UPI000C00C8E1|nr:hypothetical protein [Vibrio sp. ES.051]PFG46065.1 hypothetical protein ATG66_3159 [Vibrio sp. ES.051]